MSANRMSLTLGTRCSSRGATISLATPLTPGAIDEAVDSLSQELIKFANNKKLLKTMLESFAQESYDEYTKAVEELFK